MHRVSVSSSCSSPMRVRLSTVKKKTVVLQRAMTEKRERWQSKTKSCDAVGTTVKEETNPWNKSCPETAKRDSEVCKAAIDEKARTKRKKHDERSSSAFSKKEEEEQARGLIEEIQCNLEEAQTRSYEVEHKLGRVLGST